ncbi:unnamed protein product [Oikopleura dioica]|uniref:Uncharacterized protein n=1 Tax=Oikopleura dioica TaxID=34765 RepID=E4Y7W9_OIKDI|nr:unnamed protein product [Oikopleura dioica]
MRGPKISLLCVFSVAFGNPFEETTQQDNTKFKKECNLGKALMKHCIRIRTVCGEKIDIFSETQVVSNHPMRVHPLLQEDISRQSSKRDKNLKKLKKHVSRIEALRMAFSSEKVDRWSAVDLELVNAVEVVQDGGPYQVNIKNPEARCSSIRLRWWRSKCHACLEDGQLVEK